MQAEATFRAMGSDCHVILVGARAGALEEVRDEINRLERLWSRFIASSEISILNASAGVPQRVSRETFNLVESAVEAWRATGGVFDPTILHALVAAGYDRSFEQLADASIMKDEVRAPGCNEIGLDPDTSTIQLPPGVGFDPGGIGKGHAADHVAELTIKEGAAHGVCINLGGDVRICGEPPDGEAWAVGLEDPQGNNTATIKLLDGAIATSSLLRRRWVLAGRAMHHIIDPRTGAPVVSDLIQATVVAGDAMWAEIVAKVALMAGADDAIRIAKEHDLPALLFDVSGGSRAIGGMEAWLS